MNPSSAPAPVLDQDFPNMKTLLLVMGILIILAGLSCACMGVAYLQFMPAAMSAMESGTQKESMETLMNASVLFMIVTCACLVWLGIGSIQCRKWARDLLYSLGWALAGLAILGTIGSAFSFNMTMASMEASMSSPSSGSGGSVSLPINTSWFVILSLIMGLGMYLAPAAFLILIYGMRNVRLTVEHFQRVRGVKAWTEGYPVPILAVWTMMVWSALITLCCAWPYGDYLSGIGMFERPLLPLGILGLLVLAGVAMAAACWVMLQLKPWAWWVLVGMTALGLSAGGLSMSNMDMGAFYESTGTYTEAQLDAIRENSNQWAYIILYAVGAIAFLAWVRPHYFRNEKPAEPVTVS